MSEISSFRAKRIQQQNTRNRRTVSILEKEVADFTALSLELAQRIVDIEAMPAGAPKTLALKKLADEQQMLLLP